MLLYLSVLILEDNLLVLSQLLKSLEYLEREQPYSLTLTVLTDSLQMKRLINSNPDLEFDIILLDRDCKLNGSFHELDIERLGVEKIIAISSIIEYNDDLKKRGVKRLVEKDLSNLYNFNIETMRHFSELMKITPPRKS